MTQKLAKIEQKADETKCKYLNVPFCKRSVGFPESLFPTMIPRSDSTSATNARPSFQSDWNLSKKLNITISENLWFYYFESASICTWDGTGCQFDSCQYWIYIISHVHRAYDYLGIFRVLWVHNYIWLDTQIVLKKHFKFHFDENCDIFFINRFDKPGSF